MPTVKAFVHAKFESTWNEDLSELKKQIKYEAWPCEHDSWGLYIGTVEFECAEAKHEDIINGMVSTLKAEIQSTRAECETKVQKLEQQVQELLCLEAPKT